MSFTIWDSVVYASLMSILVLMLYRSSLPVPAVRIISLVHTVWAGFVYFSSQVEPWKFDDSMYYMREYADKTFIDCIIEQVAATTSLRMGSVSFNVFNAFVANALFTSHPTIVNLCSIILYIASILCLRTAASSRSEIPEGYFVCLLVAPTILYFGQPILKELFLVGVSIFAIAAWLQRSYGLFIILVGIAMGCRVYAPITIGVCVFAFWYARSIYQSKSLLLWRTCCIIFGATTLASQILMRGNILDVPQLAMTYPAIFFAPKFWKVENFSSAIFIMSIESIVFLAIAVQLALHLLRPKPQSRQLNIELFILDTILILFPFVAIVGMEASSIKYIAEQYGWLIAEEITRKRLTVLPAYYLMAAIAVRRLKLIFPSVPSEA